MKYALAVYGAPGTSHAPQTALNFAKAVVARGHDIVRVFFYQDGIHIASSLITVPQDESNLSREWQSFITEHNLDAVVCIAAALRRGVIDQSEAQRYQLSAYNLADHYELSGLGQLLDASQNADRLITFGA